MKKKLIAIALLSLTLLNGCALIPKNVEFFQSKVQHYPEPSSSEREYQKRVAALSLERAQEISQAALLDGATNISVPAQDEVRLNIALASSLGPPSHPAADSDDAIQDLNHAIAHRSNKIVDFAEKNDELAGKKIEGSGLFQVPYFIYLGAFLIVALIGWHLAKIVLTAATLVPNPAAAIGGSVGIAGMNITESLASKALSQIVAGGNAFLQKVDAEFNDPTVVAKIKSLFGEAHNVSQDTDVQAVVKTVTSTQS